MEKKTSKKQSVAGALSPEDQAIIDSILNNDGIKNLNQQQRVRYCQILCERTGLDPATNPFRILKAHGKDIIYAGREAVQQLSKVHNVSHEIKSREVVNECYVVTACAFTPDGRKTESLGAVAVKGKSGEELCNAMMKAETKSKRRATLDLLGLGMLDESETDNIPHIARVDMTTGEIIEGPQNSNGHNGHTVHPTPAPAPAPVPQPVGPVAETFTKKYPDKRAIEVAIIAACTVDDLIALYNANADAIEKAPALKEKLTQRKLEIKAAGATEQTPQPAATPAPAPQATVKQVEQPVAYEDDDF